MSSSIPSSGPAVLNFDFHKAITRKERSSRYLRTAIDYCAQKLGREATEEFLAEIGIQTDSSIYKHIYDDENWNSYDLEVYVYDRMKDKFPDPYQAIWEFGVASGSGHLDQKDTLFAFKILMAPVPVIVRKASEHTERMSLISECRAHMIPRNETSKKGLRGAVLHFDYTRLPENFKYPHWTSIVAGYGIVYGLFAIRKGLQETDLKITHWPNLPSDLPHFRGRRYTFDRLTKDVIDAQTGAIVANAKDGAFEIDGVMFNHQTEAIASFEYRPESLGKRIARATYQRPRLKREQSLREMRDQLIKELSIEHQAQLARYERELSEKMAEIQALKVQQDGDYFLTSLLTKPLIVGRNSSKAVTTEFIVHQKKTFEFRNHRSELGGDICVTDNVSLQNRNYTVFVNGDAMGKSMQGAGGALVLGVVYNAYISRTRFSKHQQKKSPELWLRDCYYELQNVFISFDGSMFISVVMGLIDEATGMMYFINAEHPSTVLLRDGRASFIEKDLTLRKIGTPGEEDHIQIQTFQLQSGDMIIAGSDGRDDLEIGRKNDTRIINEDEEAFLRRVEDGRGDLTLIVERLQEHGILTDDLSLLKIGYHSRVPTLLPDVDGEYRDRFRDATHLLRSGDMAQGLVVLEELKRSFPDHPETARYLGRVFYKLKEYEKAIREMEPYFLRNPGDTELAYLLSLSHKRLGQYDRAVEYGEKVVLREPRSLNYVVNLADLYRMQNNPERMQELIARARDIDPEDSKLLRLEQILENVPAHAQSLES